MLTEMRDTVGSVLLGEGIEPEKATKDQALAGDRQDREGVEGRPDPALHRQRVHARHRQGRLRRDPRLVGRRARSWPPTTRTSATAQPEEGFMIFTDTMQIPVGAPHAFTAREDAWTSSTTRRSRPQITEYVQLRAAGQGRAREISREAQPRGRRERAGLPGPGQERTTSRRSRRRTRPRSTPPSSARSARRRTDRSGEPAVTFLQRRRGLLPYLLLAPGLAVAAVLLRSCRSTTWRARRSRTGTIFTGYQFSWHFQTYTDAISNYDEQLIRSFVYAGAATLIAFAIGYPARVRDRVPRRQVEERRCCCS